MAIITRTEIKEILGIDSAETGHDTQIDALLPRIADRVHVICNDPFTVQPLDRTLYIYGARNDEYRFWRDSDLYILPLVAGVFTTAGTVTVKGENFASAQFAAGQDVFIRDSYLNDGYFEVSSISTSAMTVSSTLNAVSTAGITFEAEASGATMTIGVVKWPAGIKPLVASLIQFDYQERGSWKESDGGGFGVYGYPRRLLKDFQYYTIPTYGVAR